METHDCINTLVTSLVTAIAAAIARAIEKRKLKKAGLLKDKDTAQNDKGEN